MSTIRSVIQSSFHASLAKALDFDLYVAPPRRLLNDAKTLEEEELVPAAKIHVSWKVGGSPPDGVAGSYLREELFVAGEGKEGPTTVFPDAKPVLEERKTPVESVGKDNVIGSNAPSKEDILMQRMLGKSVGLLGGGKSSCSSKDTSDNKASKDGKPKWFKG